MTELLQQLINGVIIGSLYVIVALGLTLIYGVLVQINFAHGDFLMLAALGGAIAESSFHLPYLWTVMLAVIIGAVLGGIVELSIFKPLRKRGVDFLRPMIATIGVSVIIQNVVLLIRGASPQNYPSELNDKILRLGALYVSYQRAAIFIISVLATIALFIFLRKSTMGRAMRAVSQDAIAASLMGIEVSHVVLFTFILGSALAGLGGGLLGPLLIITPFVGSDIIVIAFAIVILGGFGNVNGTIIAGLFVGIVESLVSGYLQPGISNIFIFAILLLALAIRPTGLIAERTAVNV